jgi:phospholipid/cholesterol/gamma-HCH transport system substrate-binding protein
MEAEARYTFVGAAVLVLVAALVASLVWLKDIGGRGEFTRYAIHFEKQALDGLQLGAEVNLRGIKVGRVEDYALSRDKLNRVRVVVRVDGRAPVRSNTVAVVTRNFVTGIAAITLVTPSPAGDELTEVPDGESYPVIGEGRSDVDEIAGRVNQLGEQAANALTAVNQLLTPENRAAAMDTVRNLRDLTAGLNQRLKALDKLLERTSAAAASVGTAAGQLGNAGERVAAVAERSGAQLDQSLAQADKTLAEARSALVRVTASIEDLRKDTGAAARRLEASALHIEDELSAVAVDLRLAIESATRALDRVREPRAALFGPAAAQLGPGESK